MYLFDRCFPSNPPKIPRVDGTEVSDYFFMGNDKEFWKLDTDFPNCKIPYPEVWIEFTAPEKVVSAEEGITLWDNSYRPTHWGWRIAKFSSGLVEEHPGCQVLAGHIYEKYKSFPYPKASSCAIFLYINAQGKITKFPGKDEDKGPVLMTGPDEMLQSMSPEECQELLDSLVTMLQPALLVLCKLNSIEGNTRTMSLKIFSEGVERWP